MEAERDRLDKQDGTDSQKGEIQYFLGVALQWLRDYDGAVAGFTEAGELAPSLATLAALASFVVLWQNGRYPEAWEKLQIENLPQSHGLADVSPVSRGAELLRRGAIEFHQGNFEEAEPLFEQSRRVNDQSILLWATLVPFYLERAEHDPRNSDEWHWRAREAFEQVRALCELKAVVVESLENHLKLGVLSTALGDDQTAMRYLDEIAEKSSESAQTADINIGIILARRGDREKAVERFARAVRMAPDSLVLRGLLADTFARLGLLDRAEEEYRAILRRAPGNVEAHIGLGEVTTGRGDKGDIDAYLEAIHEFDQALELDDTMKGPLDERKASSRLSPRQRASVLYSRGYAQAKLFEKPTAWRGLPRRPLELLRGARDDFQAAWDEDNDHFRARRALNKIGRPFQALPKRLLDEWAPLAIAVLSLAVLIYVQILFVVHRVGNTSYASLTFGLLLFVIAGLYLPEISKLKVGAAELEKTVGEELPTRVGLGIPRAESVITWARAFAVDWRSGPRESELVSTARYAAEIDPTLPSAVQDAMLAVRVKSQAG